MIGEYQSKLYYGQSEAESQPIRALDKPANRKAQSETAPPTPISLP